MSGDGDDCTSYNPDEWFEVWAGGSHLCHDAQGIGSYDCYRYYGGDAPLVAGPPDLYCSGLESFPDCSELWYPWELEEYELVTLRGQTYLCERAILGYNDLDCWVYDGGLPFYAIKSFGELKCTRYGSSYECRTDAYPSQLEGYYFATISGGDYICEETGQGSRCWRWSGSWPAFGLESPRYYCNNYGCDRIYYPDPG